LVKHKRSTKLVPTTRTKTKIQKQRISTPKHLRGWILKYGNQMKSFEPYPKNLPLNHK